MTNIQTSQRQAPIGWRLSNHPQTFSGHAGPFYFREEGPTPGVGFFSKPHHGNMGGVVHGGMLMTLADMSLFDICFRKKGQFKAVTVSMNTEFVGPGPIGAFIEASGDLVKAGKTLFFVRGLVTAADAPILSFSGVLKRLG